MMVSGRKFLAAVPALLFAAIAFVLPAAAADLGALKNSNVLERLAKQTGVYRKSPTGTTPDFMFDPAWPQRLPHNWIMGPVVGIFVDKHEHIWVNQRPRALTYSETALDPAIPGAVNAKGQPIDGNGNIRVYGTPADCCRAAPSILEFDTDGKLLRAWGGPADPGFIGGKCKVEAGCIWPNGEHGIYVDDKDNVWVGGNNPDVPGTITPWTTNREGGDGFILKFDRDGNFKMRIGGTPKGPVSNDTNGGINGTPLMYEPAEMVLDPNTNRFYIADGYGNRRVLIVDADTGKYIGHFGAYGGNPVDDAAITAVGLWKPDQAKGNIRPAFFRNAVHCVSLAHDGKLYVCDRGNNRIQVFDTKDPMLGKPCSNPNGETGKCGYLAEQAISGNSEAEPVLSGTAVSVGFSRDKAQSCAYVSDDTNMTIYILNRSNLQELGQLGKLSQTPGDFRWMHQIAVDSKGNIYTSEAGVGRRVQKFLHYGAVGCSGTGSTVVGGPVPE